MRKKVYSKPELEFFWFDEDIVTASIEDNDTLYDDSDLNADNDVDSGL